MSASNTVGVSFTSAAALPAARLSQRTLQRGRKMAAAAGLPPPPCLPSLMAPSDCSVSPWLTVEDGHYVNAPATFVPNAAAVPASDVLGRCSECGASVGRGLRTCYHWRLLHSERLCEYGYAARGGFGSPHSALAWAQDLLATVGRRVAARGSTYFCSLTQCIGYYRVEKMNVE